MQAPADLESEAEKENNEETGSTAWLCGKDVCAGAIAVRDAVNHNPALCRRICAAQRLSLYDTPADDFQAVLCMLRSTLECKAATEALLAHFGGDRPHDGAWSVYGSAISHSDPDNVVAEAQQTTTTALAGLS